MAFVFFSARSVMPDICVINKLHFAQTISEDLPYIQQILEEKWFPRSTRTKNTIKNTPAHTVYSQTVIKTHHVIVLIKQLDAYIQLHILHM